MELIATCFLPEKITTPVTFETMCPIGRKESECRRFCIRKGRALSSQGHVYWRLWSSVFARTKDGKNEDRNNY